MDLSLWVSEVPFSWCPRLVRWGCRWGVSLPFVLGSGPDSSGGGSVKNSGYWEMARTHSSSVDALVRAFTRVVRVPPDCRPSSRVYIIWFPWFWMLAAMPMTPSRVPILCFSLTRFLCFPCFPQRSVSFRPFCLGTVDLGRFRPYFTRTAHRIWQPHSPLPRDF